MAVSKEKINDTLKEKIVFLYLLVFPFGQLIGFNFNLYGTSVRIYPTDFLAGIAFILFILGYYRLNNIFKSMLWFLGVGFFSTLISYPKFRNTYLIIGLLHLLRLASYSTLFLLAANIVTNNKNLRSTIYNSLIAVTATIGLFGWMQYFWVPDLTSLRYIGWDDHKFRLVGTFLDPTFTGILLVFGFLLTLFYYFKSKGKALIFLLIYFLLTIAFTYTRAAYLALLASLVLITAKQSSWRNHKAIISILMAIIFTVIIILLPRPDSVGVRLERTFSINSKMENYKQTLSIIKKNPLFGVGFNNFCGAKLKYLDNQEVSSHSCSGSDSSLLLIFATTGVVGFFLFTNVLIKIIKEVQSNIYGKAFLTAGVALLIHSLFVNSLFYPWVLGFMFILLALSLKFR